MIVMIEVVKRRGKRAIGLDQTQLRASSRSRHHASKIPVRIEGSLHARRAGLCSAIVGAALVTVSLASRQQSIASVAVEPGSTGKSLAEIGTARQDLTRPLRIPGIDAKLARNAAGSAVTTGDPMFSQEPGSALELGAVAQINDPSEIARAHRLNSLVATPGP
jgi:hypothetical protein